MFIFIFNMHVILLEEIRLSTWVPTNQILMNKLYNNAIYSNAIYNNAIYALQKSTKKIFALI